MMNESVESNEKNKQDSSSKLEGAPREDKVEIVRNSKLNRNKENTHVKETMTKHKRRPTIRVT